MGELTKEDIKDALQEVVSNPLFVKQLESVIIGVVTDKFERTLNVDCTDAEKRDRARQNMVMLNKAVTWYETSEGQSAMKTAGNIIKIAQIVESKLFQVLAISLIAGWFAFFHEGIKSSFFK